MLRESKILKELCLSSDFLDKFDFTHEIDSTLTDHENIVELRKKIYGGQNRDIKYYSNMENEYMQSIAKKYKQRKAGSILSPLKRPRQLKVFSVFDIETDQKDNTKFEKLGYYSEKEGYKLFYSASDFLDFYLAFSHRNIPCFAHNLAFDGQFLLNELILRKEYVTKPLLSGSKLISVLIKDENRNAWNFRDSFSIMPSSLKKLTHDFKVEHQKVEIEKAEDRLTNPDYLYNDVLGLYEVLKEYKKEKEDFVAFTCASGSMGLFRYKYMKKPFQRNERFSSLFRQTYKGARTEIFNFNLDFEKKFYFYDVNSLYPFVMKENLFPIGKMRFTSCDFENEGISYIKVHDSNYYPILCEWSGVKLLFMDKNKEGWFSNPEVRYLIEKGVRIEVKKSLVTSDSDYIFKDFVEDLYKRRKEAKEKENYGLDFITKIDMNSLYGKFGQKTNRRMLFFNPKECYEGMHFISDYISEMEIKGDANFIIPIIASYVTAYSRCYMHEQIMGKEKENVYYMDTDSIYTDKKLFKDGKNIGEFKLEKEVRGLCLFMPKLYSYFDGEDNLIYKARGVIKDSKNTFVELISGKEIEQKAIGVQTLRKSIITNRTKHESTYLFQRVNKKSMKSFYDKRLINPDLSTSPLKSSEEALKNREMCEKIRAEFVKQFA